MLQAIKACEFHENFEHVHEKFEHVHDNVMRRVHKKSVLCVL